MSQPKADKLRRDITARYPSEGPEQLAHDHGVTIEHIRRTASRLGVRREVMPKAKGPTYRELKELFYKLRLENIKLIIENRKLRKGEQNGS